MGVQMFSAFSVEDLQQIYAHAESLAHLIADIPALVPLATELESLPLRLEFHFQDIDPLVNRQPVVVRAESLEVQ